MTIKQLKPTFFISVLLLFSFFLPWMSSGRGEPNGWVLPGRFTNVSFFLGSFSHEEYLDWIFKLAYLVYLVPAITAYNIYKRLTRRRPAVNEYFIGLLAAFLLFFLVRLIDMNVNNTLVKYINTEMDLKIYKLLTGGYYLFIGCCIVGLYFTVIHECDDYLTFEEEMQLESEQYASFPIYESPEIPKDKDNTDDKRSADRTRVYESLEQLHRLYEKGIISDEEFNEEKKQLLK